MKIFNNQFPLKCIVAMSKNNIIGDGNKLPWHIPNDLKRLKKITLGNPLIMGRKTFSSIGKPLVGRLNVVLTRDTNLNINGVILVNSIEEAIIEANKWINKNFETKEYKYKNIFIFGGAEVYSQTLEYCNYIDLTLVDINLRKGIKFPRLDSNEWNKKLINSFTKTSSTPSYSHWIYERI